jgi:hypothetical protein
MGEYWKRQSVPQEQEEKSVRIGEIYSTNTLGGNFYSFILSKNLNIERRAQ